MDDADLAGRFDELNIKTSLYASRKDEPEAVAIGTCLFCEEPFDDAQDRPGGKARRWCDAACRDDWERENT